jgi:hypothetical protein
VVNIIKDVDFLLAKMGFKPNEIRLFGNLQIGEFANWPNDQQDLSILAENKYP